MILSKQYHEPFQILVVLRKIVKKNEQGHCLYCPDGDVLTPAFTSHARAVTGRMNVE